MPITRTENPDGSWEEKAEGAKSVQELREKHDPGLAKRGAEDFQRKWTEQEKVGFEELRGPDGAPTHVVADQVQTALSRDGYRPMNKPRTVVPFLPWQADRKYGETYSAYMRRKAETQAQD